MKEEPFLQVPNDVLYGMRLIVFLEESPQSNIYRQVLLDDEKFKKVSDSVCTVINKKGDMENVEIRL